MSVDELRERQLDNAMVERQVLKKQYQAAEAELDYWTRLQNQTPDEGAIKRGFYAGQAMAGVELEECHKNWKRWNVPTPNQKET